MAYCTREQVDAALSPALLAQLTDDTAGTAVDEDIIAEAMTLADGEIEAYVGRTVTTFTTVPPILARVAVQLTLYFLFLRRNLADEVRAAEYRNCQKILNDIATGRLQLAPLAGLPPASEAVHLVAL